MKSTFRERITRLFLECVGSFLIAVSITNFAAAYDFPLTGFSGIALIIHRLTGLSTGWVIILLNIPVAFLCFRKLGKGFFFRSITCMVISSLMTDYLSPLFPAYRGNIMLAAVCTGVLSGIGYSLIYMQNSSTGGADFVIMAVKRKWPHLQLGTIIFACAVTVIGATWLIFGNFEGVLYGLIINYISGAVTDKMMYNANAGKFLMAITDVGEDVAKAIDDACSRGATIIPANGGYRQDPHQVVICACSTNQIYKIEKVVKGVDPSSFVVIWSYGEVRGEGFRVVSVAGDD